MRRSPIFTPLASGPELRDATDDLVSHRERQHHAAVLQRHLLAAADVVIAFPDVQAVVGMTDAAMRHLDQHLGAFGSGVGSSTPSGSPFSTTAQARIVVSRNRFSQME